MSVRVLAAIAALALAAAAVPSNAAADAAAIEHYRRTFAADATGGRSGPALPTDPAAQELLARLKALPYKLLHEKNVGGNWEIFRCDADGSNPVNLTNTPDIHELYPHASPDGSRISFIVETGRGPYVRDVYFMNADGSGRTLVTENGKEPAWSPDGKTLIFMRGPDTPSSGYYTSKELVYYDIASGESRVHPVPLENYLNICFTPDGKWIIGTYQQIINAVEVGGENRVLTIINQEPNTTGEILGCRPDVSPDGRHVAWAVVDRSKVTWIDVADIDTSGPEPKVVNERHVAVDTVPIELYHADWSPDGRYIAFSRGTRGNRMKTARYVIGTLAPTWNICVVDLENPGLYVELTTDGQSNKEPDWLPVTP